MDAVFSGRQSPNDRCVVRGRADRERQDSNTVEVQVRPDGFGVMTRTPRWGNEAYSAMQSNLFLRETNEANRRSIPCVGQLQSNNVARHRAGSKKLTIVKSLASPAPVHGMVPRLSTAVTRVN